ncbi:hypothetical protein JNJ66_02255 [Candidatus Saccharibacteria bacterium]|nr:hypothetical protein [Candidatus Saccharibacteria bacterium]
MTSKNFADLRSQITDIYNQRANLLKELRAAKSKLGLLSFVHYSSYPLIFGFFYKGIAAKRAAQQEVVRRLEKRLSETFVTIKFADASQLEKSWLNCLDTYDELAQSQKIWDLTYAENIDRVKVRTTADTAVKRTAVTYAPKDIEIIKSDVRPIFIPNANGPDVFIYPTFLILFKDNQRFGIFDLKEVKGSLSFTSYHEEEKVPSDGEVIGQTWKKANKDGSRDKRFQGNNYQIPVLKYGSMTLETSDGLQESYMFSSAEAFTGFAEALGFHLKHLK